MWGYSLYRWLFWKCHYQQVFLSVMSNWQRHILPTTFKSWPKKNKQKLCTSTDGIKLNSFFLVHLNLFERIVANDLAVKHLVTVKKHFAYNELNRATAQFRHLGIFTMQLKKMADDLVVLLHRSGVSWGSYVGSKNPMDSEVWQLCLKLKQMVGLICAPKIIHNEIGYLKFLPQECLCKKDRVSCWKFESKMLHYADLILRFGLWFACGPSGLKVNIHILWTVQGNCIILCIFVKLWQKGTSCSSPI